MLYLDVFLTQGCPSEDETRRLAASVSRAFTNVTVTVRDGLDADIPTPMPGLVIVPAFVLDGHLIGLGPLAWSQLRQALQRCGGTLAPQEGGVHTAESDGGETPRS